MRCALGIDEAPVHTVAVVARSHHHPIDDDLAAASAGATELAAKVELAGRALLRLLATLSRASDLGTLDLLVLLRAAHPEGVEASEIRRGLEVSTGTMSGVVDRLEAAKLIRRERSRTDRRRVILALTRKGRQVHERLMGPLQTRLVEGVDALEASERGVVDQLLEYLLVALQEHTDDLEGSRAGQRNAALRRSRAPVAKR